MKNLGRYMQKILIIAGTTINLLSLVMAFVTNFNAFLIGVFCASALMVVYGLCLRSKKLLIVVTIAVVALLVLFIGFNVFLYRFGQHNTVTYEEDAVIVLGAGVVGETPSLILAARLNTALAYYRQNDGVLIVVSGGQGPNEDITEALAMERYLVARGVPIENILKEEESTTTRENMIFSKRLLDEYFDGAYTTAFITNDFHIFRAGIIASRVGLNCTHMHAKIPRYSVPANYLRETIAVLAELILPY